MPYAGFSDRFRKALAAKSVGASSGQTRISGLWSIGDL